MLGSVTAMEEEYDEIFEQISGKCELKFHRREVVIQKCSKKKNVPQKFQKIQKNTPARWSFF